MRAFVAQVFTDRAACDRALNLLVDRVDPPALDQRLVPAHPLMTTKKVWKQQCAAAGPFVSPFTTNTAVDVANLERNPHLLLPVFSRPLLPLVDGPRRSSPTQTPSASNTEDLGAASCTSRHTSRQSAEEEVVVPVVVLAAVRVSEALARGFRRFPCIISHSGGGRTAPSATHACTSVCKNNVTQHYRTPTQRGYAPLQRVVAMLAPR